MDIQTKVNIIKKSVEESFTITLIYKDSEEKRTVSVATLKLAKNNNIILGAWDLNAQGYRSFDVDLIKNITINDSLGEKSTSKNYIDDKDKIAIANFSVKDSYSGSISLMNESKKREILSENSTTSENILIIESAINYNENDLLHETYKLLEFKYLSKSGELKIISNFLPSSITYSENTKNLIVTGTLGATDEFKSFIRSYNLENINSIAVNDHISDDIFDAIKNNNYIKSKPNKVNAFSIFSWIGMACLIAIGIFSVTNK